MNFSPIKNLNTFEIPLNLSPSAKLEEDLQEFQLFFSQTPSINQIPLDLFENSLEVFRTIEKPEQRAAVLDVLKRSQKKSSSDFFSFYARLFMILAVGLEENWAIEKFPNIVRWDHLLKNYPNSEVLLEGLHKWKMPHEKGKELIVISFLENRLDVAEALISTHFFTDLNGIVMENGYTPLSAACKCGYTDFVEKLLQEKKINVLGTQNFACDFTNYRSSPLMQTVIHDHPQIALRLLNNKENDLHSLYQMQSTFLSGKKITSSPFQQIVSLNRLECLKIVLDNYDITHDKIFFLQAYLEGTVELADLIVESGKIDFKDCLDGLVKKKNGFDFFKAKKIQEASPDIFDDWLRTNLKGAVLYHVSLENDEEALRILNKLFEENPDQFFFHYFDNLCLINFLFKHRKTFLKKIFNSNTFKFFNIEEKTFFLRDLHPSFYDYIDNTGILRIKGMELILKHLKEKKTPSLYLDDVIEVCEGYEELNTKLKHFLLNSSLKGDVTISFLIENIQNKQTNRGAHITHVSVQKICEEWNVVVSDSTDYSPYINPIVDCIESISKEPEIDFKIKRLFLSSLSRQKDSINCSIFAIRDSVFFANSKKQSHSIPFFDLMEEKLSDVSTQKIYLKFEDLPPNLLKMTQSATTIKNYIEKKGDLLLTTKKNEIGTESLNDYLVRHEKDGYHQAIKRRGDKYRTIIIEELISQLTCDEELI